MARGVPFQLQPYLQAILEVQVLYNPGCVMLFGHSVKNVIHPSPLCTTAAFLRSFCNFLIVGVCLICLLWSLDIAWSEAVSLIGSAKATLQLYPATCETLTALTAGMLMVLCPVMFHPTSRSTKWQAGSPELTLSPRRRGPG